MAEYHADYLSRIGKQDLAGLVDWLLESYREAQRGLIYECYGGKVMDGSLKEEALMKQNWFRKLLEALSRFRDELAWLGLLIWYWPKQPPAK